MINDSICKPEILQYFNKGGPSPPSPNLHTQGAAFTQQVEPGRFILSHNTLCTSNSNTPPPKKTTTLHYFHNGDTFLPCLLLTQTRTPDHCIPTTGGTRKAPPFAHNAPRLLVTRSPGETKAPARRATSPAEEGRVNAGGAAGRPRGAPALRPLRLPGAPTGCESGGGGGGASEAGQQLRSAAQPESGAVAWRRKGDRQRCPAGVRAIERGRALRGERGPRWLPRSGSTSCGCSTSPR